MTDDTPETLPDGRQIDDIRDKTRRLNDSLKTLAVDGVEKLAQATQQSTRTTASRKPAGDIINAELGKLLRQEITAGIAGLFSGRTGGIAAPLQQNAPPVAVTVINNTPAQVTVRENMDGFDQKQLEIMIDQMVAESMVRGRHTSGVMRSLFGLMPGLSGR